MLYRLRNLECKNKVSLDRFHQKKNTIHTTKNFINMQKRFKFAIIVLCLYLTSGADCQIYKAIQPDTLTLKLDSIERIFLKKNLVLLAQHYNRSEEHTS